MKKISFLILSMLFAGVNLYADNLQHIEEEYTISKGDTLSGVLYSKGVHGGSLLYGSAGNDGCVSENKELNPQISNWDALRPGTVIKLKYPSSMQSMDVEQNYVIQKGDTLSGVLFNKGTKGIKTLYAKDGYVEKNKKMNSNISDWNNLTYGATIKLVYKRISNTSVTDVKPVEAKVEKVEAQEVKTEAVLPLSTDQVENAKSVEAKTLDESLMELNKEDNASDYFLEHRFFLGFGAGYNKENQVTQSINTRGAITFPVLQYQLLYRPTRDLDASSWEYRFLFEASKGLTTRSVNMPLGGKIELDFGRYSLLKFGTTKFNPNINFIFDANSSITSDTNSNLSARERRAIWIGVKPELVSYIGSTMIEYYPFVYKSVYMKSRDDRFDGWEFGFKTNVGIAFDNSLFGSFEYSYQRFQNSAPTVVLSLQDITFGVGYKF